LLQCLQRDDVNSILVVNRRPCEVNHPKLKEILVKDFFDLSPIEKEMKSYDACLFCLGISSVGISKEAYYKSTYELTMHFAKTLKSQNSKMSFIYVSGAGTDSTEKGKLSWARVKGKTENDLMKLGFKQVFAFRPGFIKPAISQRRAKSYYRYLMWIFPPGRILYPNGFCTMEELATAMIRVVKNGYYRKIIEGKDIVFLGKSL
jgi:hypothetical protein